MVRLFSSLGILIVLAQASCQTQSAPTFKPRLESQPEKPIRTSHASMESYLGLSKKAAAIKAERIGMRSRIVRDGFERYPITKDLRPDRINFEIDQGVVTSAKIF